MRKGLIDKIIWPYQLFGLRDWARDRLQARHLSTKRMIIYRPKLGRLFICSVVPHKKLHNYPHHSQFIPQHYLTTAFPRPQQKLDHCLSPSPLPFAAISHTVDCPKITNQTTHGDTHYTHKSHMHTFFPHNSQLN